MKKIIILILVLINTGCWSTKLLVETITPRELDEIKCECQELTVSQWFYAGPEDGYHLFVHRDLPKDKYYNVKRTGNIDNYRVIPDESQWILMPWGPEEDECKK